MAFASRVTRRERGPAQADSSRRRVLDLLDASDRPLTITEITSGTGLHANTARYHLALLADMGRVEAVREDQQGHGSANDMGMDVIALQDLPQHTV